LAYDERRGEEQRPLLLSGHEHVEDVAAGPRWAVGQGAYAELHELRCESCGYGGAVSRQPARCPICGNRTWIVVDAQDSMPAEQSTRL
jgi:rubrerythrin